MAATYDGDGNRTFQLKRQVIPFSIEKAEQDDSQDSETGDSVGGTEDSETTSNPQNDSSSLPDTTGVEQDEVYTYYEKVYANPADSIFWYGFGQGTVQFFANVNTSLGAYLSDWLCHAWDAITSQYELALHSDAVYSEEDIEAMRNAGLSEEEIIEITGCEVDKNGEFMLECENSKSQDDLITSEGKKEFAKVNDNGVIVIPSNPDEKTRIDYDLSYYVNDINTANTQVLMTYGRNKTEKAVYVYGEGRIAEDDLQTDETSEYLYDGRGSVVQTTIEAEIDMSLTYDPFGEITSGADVNFVGYAYNGEESNEVTGLQYLRARYYDTELGTFITIDTYLGSLDDTITQNRYTYANNDPVNNIDPSGHYSVNVNGTSQYYQTTGLNELRDYMTAAALWAGQVTAQSSFNGSVARASNTSFMNYQSITGISQSTANSYINKGIAQAGQVSMNYGCSVPTVPNQAVAKFSNNVNAAKNSANAQISSIKQQKKVQYDEYQAYLRWLEEQRRIAEELRRKLSEISEGIYSNLKNILQSPFGGSQTEVDSVYLYQSVIGAKFEPGLSEYIGWGNDLYNAGKRGYNLHKYRFNVIKSGDYAIIKGARSKAAISQEIYGTKYALKNADDYSQVFEYIDVKTATKGAFKLLDDSGKINGGAALNYLTIAVDVGKGIYDNYQDGAEVQEYISDGVVDTGFGAGGILASTAAGAYVGSIVPVAGNFFGAIAGFAAGLLYYAVTDVITIRGKTIEGWAKEGAEWVADKIAGVFK